MVAELLKARSLPALKLRKEMLSLLEKEYGKMPRSPVSVSFITEENRIPSAFPYWFSKEFGALPDEPEQLPFDQHYLIASIAPRYVLIGSASEDAWCDPVSEFLSGGRRLVYV